MDKLDVMSWCSTGFGFSLTLITNERLYTIVLILAILNAVINIALAIFKGLKNAKKDGKISLDEIVDITQDVGKILEETKQEVEEQHNANKPKK